MTYKTHQRLEKLADALEKFIMMILEALMYALQLITIDAVWGKAKYRKRTSPQRPIIHRTYNRTVVYRTLYTPRLPRPKERVYTVKTKE